MVYDMHIIISSVSIIRELKNHNEVHDDDVSWLGKDWNENVSFSVKKETYDVVGRLVDDDDTECKHKCKTVMFVHNKVFCSGVF